MMSVVEEQAEGSDKLIRVPIGFPPDLYEWMRELAFRRRTAMADIVREAVREYRDRLEPQLGLPLNGR
jgi:hypothetical protein